MKLTTDTAGISSGDSSSHSSTENVGQETPPAPPRSTNGHPTVGVVCEEASDDGSLFKAFTVWRSNFVFGNTTRVRHAATSSSLREPPRTEQQSNRVLGNQSNINNNASHTAPHPVAAVVSSSVPHLHGRPFEAAEYPGVLVTKSSVPAHLLNKDAVVLMCPISPADVLMVTGAASANTTAANTRPRTSSKKNTKNSRRLAAPTPAAQNHLSALPRIGEEGESMCSTVLMHRNTSISNNNVPNVQDNNQDGEDCSQKSGGLEMGSIHEQAYYRRGLASSYVHEDDENTNMDSSFFTRTGAPDSKFREYALDVDPTDGDRAADLFIFSWARPHMRGFHLAWMSFFVAL